LNVSTLNATSTITTSTLTTTNSVGIGTTSPVGNFHVYASSGPPVPTPQDNRELIEQQAKQIAELTALVQQLINNK
jgi:hypothetical protein